MKSCTKCITLKHLIEFYKEKRNKDGHRSECKVCTDIARQANYLANKDRELNRRREWEKLNRRRLQDQRNVRMRSSPVSRLKNNLRRRLNKALHTGSAVRDLGCSIQELKTHLESKFQSGMNWNNYGQWHIDHIRPLASFDLTDRSQLLAAVNYANLQPLWAEDNLKKSNKVA